MARNYADEQGNLKLACRKPGIFIYGGDFGGYVENWLNYASILRIPEEYLFRTLLTYLDAKCQDRIRALKLIEIDKDDINICLPRMKQVLGPNKSAVWARIKLFSSVQEACETITDFADKLRKLADVAYVSDELKNDIIVDIFIDGIRNDEISVKLRMNPKAKFQDVFEEALKLESAYSIRKK